MVREELQSASEELRRAAEAVDGDAQERIYEQSNQLATLATRDAGPDHGRLDRHMHALKDIADGLDGDAEERVLAARDQVREYRTGVEGV